MQVNPYGIEALWQQSDPMIVAITLALLIMSIASWSVIVIHSWRIWRLHQRRHKLENFWTARNFSAGVEELGANDPNNPYYYLAKECHSAMVHYQTRQTQLFYLQSTLPVADWLNTSLRGGMDECAERMQRSLSVLASVGSTAPFVGLLGTVWGIYHALVNIGVSGQASIDKVAGPVGEALIMTAFGLAVAIPAVLGYNALVRKNKSILGKLNRFAYELHAYFLTGAPLIKRQDTSKTTVSQLRPELEVS